MNASLPVCLMIMPYGKKQVGAAQEGIAEIYFDVLWDRALRPAIELIEAEVRPTEQVRTSLRRPRSIAPPALSLPLS
jgi:hypothetical protein